MSDDSDDEATASAAITPIRAFYLLMRDEAMK